MMMRSHPLYLLAIPLVCFAAFGCGESTSSVPDGGTASDGSTARDSGIDCNAPARECPPVPPLVNGPCEGALRCTYDPTGNPGGEAWIFECEGGAFTEQLLCDGCAPQLAERCRDPFTGTLADVTLTVGTASGEFRALADGDPIDPVFGAQGATMVQYRVRLEGEGLPDCASIGANVALDGTAFDNEATPIKLRCGQTLGIFAVLPDNPCEFRDYDVDLTIDVPGIGSTTVSDLVLAGGGCPRGVGP